MPAAALGADMTATAARTVMVWDAKNTRALGATGARPGRHSAAPARAEIASSRACHGRLAGVGVGRIIRPLVVGI